MKRGDRSSTRRSKSQTRLLAYDLCSYSILMGLIAVSRTPPPPPPERPSSHFFRPDLCRSCRWGCGGLGTRVQECRSAPRRSRTLRRERSGPHAGLRRDTSISHIDIIPMFYLSPCNSFYISGLCSLASVQSQPRDTGL